MFDTLYLFTIETWRVSIADSCTFHVNNVLQCHKSLAAGIIPINTWQQRASLPFKPTQGHRLQVKMLLMFYGEMVKLFQLP